MTQHTDNWVAVLALTAWDLAVSSNVDQAPSRVLFVCLFLFFVLGTSKYYGRVYRGPNVRLHVYIATQVRQEKRFTNP